VVPLLLLLCGVAVYTLGLGSRYADFGLAGGLVGCALVWVSCWQFIHRLEGGPARLIARSFVDGATQAIDVALQRSIVRDQLRRAHVWRSLGGDAFSSLDIDCDGDLGGSVRASSQSSEGAAA
jgi:hypothetical protein